MKKFSVLYLSIIIVGFLLLPFNLVKAEKQKCSCRCTGQDSSGLITDECREWDGGQIETDETHKFTACSPPCQSATLSGCQLREYFAENCVSLEAPAAEKGGAPAPISLTNPIAATSVPKLVGSIIKAVLGIVGALALIMFVYGGFMWLTSGGSADKIKKGKDILIWAVIGLAVIFASYALVDFVIKALGA